jgi:peptidoglycan/LPS O-acetylase OafA/YrhL
LLVSLALRHWVGGLMVYLPLFAIGMLAFESQRDGSVRALFRRKWVAPMAILSLVVGMLSAPTPYSVLQLPFYGFFFVAVACGNDLFGALRTKGSLLLGESSYGIYLLHGIVLNVLFVEGASITSAMTTNELPALIPIVALAVACISAITYAVIERPAMRAGALLSRHTKERQITDDIPMRISL